MNNQCTGLCRFDYENKICLGCGKTQLEIRRWAEMSGVERYSTIQRVNFNRMSEEERRRRYDRG